MKVVGVAGIEPTMAESKSAALPLGDTPLYQTGAVGMWVHFVFRRLQSHTQSTAVEATYKLPDAVTNVNAHLS